jgi:hypothetical protein
MWRPYTEYPGTAFAGPFERTVQALASSAFCVAAMLAYHALEYDIPEGHRQDEKIMRLVALTAVEPDDDGTHMDASVEVELSDGTTRKRACNEAPANIFFHDRLIAIDLFEQRLAGLGFPAGRGRDLATAVLDTAAGRGTLNVRMLLDRLAA